MNNSNKQPYLIFAAIIIAGVMVAGAIVWKQNGAEKIAQIASPDTKTENDIKPSLPANTDPAGEGDDPILGNLKAPITMVVFGDFQCHFCKQLETQTMPYIKEKYIKTGKVKLIERDFAFLGEESIYAAEAANCAFEQNKYWEYADVLHNVQTGHDATVFNKENLKSFAVKIGLDAGQFNECLDSDKYLDEVKKDFEAGQALGVTGTPTSFINEERLSGALPFEDFEKVIERLLE